MPLSHLRFNRMEWAGSLGDLGTLLPLAIGMILINKLNPMGVLLGVGFFYIFSGLYFKVTCPVEPMKVIGAYAVATGITASQIQASAVWLFVFLAIIGGTGMITSLGRRIPLPVIRGVQLSTGVLLVTQGVRLIHGSSKLQLLHGVAEPYLLVRQIGPVPVGLFLGASLAILALFLLDNKRVPAAIVVVGAGAAAGLIFGAGDDLALIQPGLYIPAWLPYGWPSINDFSFALLALALPQIPMTLGNAVIANADLSLQYFPEDGRRVTYRALCISMALANLLSALIGGIPMCHGAGGLASRYRFGARTAGSNLIIGAGFVILAVLFGPGALRIISLLPMSALGVLLLFAGAQLALTLLDITTRKELFVSVLILGITLAVNLAAGFLIGIAVAIVLKSDKTAI